MSERLEQTLAGLSIFEPLRIGEVGRLAQKFEAHTLSPGATRTFDATAPRMVVVVSGTLDLDVDLGHDVARARLSPGDSWGVVQILSGRTRSATARAHGDEDVVLATIDEPGVKEILAEYPVVALPLAIELASYLSSKNDERRRVLELHAEMMSGDALKEAVADEKEAVVRRAVKVSRTGPRALFNALVVRKGAEPPFWMLLGFLSSLAGARLVVALILKYGLEKRLFALVQGTDPNPMHVHHFNYGLILASTAGVSAMFPLGRRALRVLAAIFGIGIGLIFDEFALIWNLNPEYAQSLSLITAALVAIAFVQVIWFRNFWGAVARRFLVPRSRR
jgi:CRP-like cAMP-binding protein